MSRELLPYLNASINGNGIEGLVNWANSSVNNWLVPIFLLIFYFLSIYILSEKSGWKLGFCILWVSFAFFILSMVIQTFTTFNQFIIFIFPIGMLVGFVMGFVENAR